MGRMADDLGIIALVKRRLQEFQLWHPKTTGLEGYLAIRRL